LNEKEEKGEDEKNGLRKIKGREKDRFCD